MTPVLSVIIPAYNEAGRLPATVSHSYAYLEKRFGRDFEMIVVDDGSTDATVAVVHELMRDRPRLRLLEQRANRGKGVAVRRGMREATGSVRLFTDADGSTPIEEVEKVFREIQGGADVVIASRQHAGSDIRVHQPWLREHMGKTFNLLVQILLFKGIKDTQCGFKAFTADAARAVFPRQTLAGFSFDVEILHIARRAGLRITEIPVVWTNEANSRVHILRDSIRMFLDLLVIRMRHRGLRRNTLSLIIALLLLFSAAPISAFAGSSEAEPSQPQPTEARRTKTLELNGEYLMGYLTDTKDIITAPGRWDKSDWMRASIVAGVTVALYLSDDEIKTWVQRNRSKTSDTVAKYAKPFGDGKYTLPPLGLLYAYGHFYENERAVKTGLLGIESFVVANVFTQALKNLGHRHRPSSGDPADSWDGPTLAAPGSHASFPSGHATSAFAVMTVIATEYRDTAVVPPLAYGIATLAALSRVNDNNHWASDVFFGSAVGYFSAKAITSYHDGGNTAKVSISPLMDGEHMGLSVSYSF